MEREPGDGGAGRFAPRVRQMGHRSRTMNKLSFFCVLAAVLVLSSSISEASSEIISRIEVDSNVNRGITQRKSASAFSVLLSTEKQPTGESRLEWVYDGVLQAAGYFTYTDLSYADLSTSGALLYRPHARVTAALRPFASARVVQDSEQSSVTIGAQASLSEQLSPTVSLTQYYVYRQAFARANTYSYGMHTGGLTVVALPARNLLADLNYELSYGDSFVSPGPGRKQGGNGGPDHGGGEEKSSGRPEHGQGGRFSSVFDQFVVKEKITLHTLGFRLQIDITSSWFCALRYSYGAWTGESGNSSVQLGSFSVGWRF